MHNGIIENHEQQRERLRGLGYAFESQTDTEVVAHLIPTYRTQGATLLGALQQAVGELDGAYAIAVIDKQRSRNAWSPRAWVARCCRAWRRREFRRLRRFGDPVVDAPRDLLEEGDTAELTRDGVHVFDADGDSVQREEHLSDVSLASLELGPYRHFMQKEIHEQHARSPTDRSIARRQRIHRIIVRQGCRQRAARIDSVQILACGTSFYAGLVARYGSRLLPACHAQSISPRIPLPR